MNRFKRWCAKERVGRIEEGTSQDMCPTNGDTLFMAIMMSLACAPFLIGIIVKAFTA